MANIDYRSKLLLKNIGIGFFAKGFSILISFFCVPITLGYLNDYEYGVWITLNSIFSWISLTDIGLGNGLRNKLTEALAQKDYDRARGLVSTAFLSISIIIIIVYILFLSACHFINWYTILNVEPSKIMDLEKVIIFSCGFICLGFIFRLLGNIFMALQIPSINDILNLICGIISFLAIYILAATTQKGSLLYVASIFTGVPLIVYSTACIITFTLKKHISPRLYFVKLKYVRTIYSLGFKFFILQISGILIFTTSNLIISQLFGPKEVTPYNLAFKYMSILSIGFTIVLTPFWSAVTDAITRGEYDWVKKTVISLNKIWGLSVICAIIMTIICDWVYKIWLNDSIDIPMHLTIACAAYACVSNWNNIYSYILSGTGKLQIQLWLASFQGIIYIPCAIILGKVMGLVGIPIALTCVLLLSSILPPIQCYKIINQTASGIWTK